MPNQDVFSRLRELKNADQPYKAIAKQLNSEGYTTPTGKKIGLSWVNFNIHQMKYKRKTATRKARAVAMNTNATATVMQNQSRNASNDLDFIRSVVDSTLTTDQKTRVIYAFYNDSL